MAFKRQLASLLYHDICDLCFSWQYNFDRLLMQLPSPKNPLADRLRHLRGIRLATSRLPLSSLSVAETPYHRTNALIPFRSRKAKTLARVYPCKFPEKRSNEPNIPKSAPIYCRQTSNVVLKLRQWNTVRKILPWPGIINTSSNVPYEETFQLIGSCFTQLKVQIFGHREFHHGCSDCIANIPTWANLFNKHGSIRQCKRLPLGAGLPRPCACALPGARGAPPRRRPVRLMENWSRDDRNDTAGCLAPRAARLEEWSQRAFLTRKRDYRSLWAPSPFPRYPSTCISKIFLRPEPCKWTPASASEKEKKVAAPAAKSRPFTTMSRKVHHWQALTNTSVCFVPPCLKAALQPVQRNLW